MRRDNTTCRVLYGILHLAQFVLAVVVIGLYGDDVARSEHKGNDIDGRWIYAVVVGSLSAVTAIVFLIPAISRFIAVPIWSFAIFVLWVAVFGVFGRLSWSANPDDNIDLQRIRIAVWLDLVNVILWLLGTVMLGVEYWTSHPRSTRFTGRAKL
ncbi:hypothetical protein GGS24DRAFT_455973 [Hypoxylon argillaceum]|nr:hypothetical protein GGS24DRAFT_455973 [Hypoxylon argillaceum]KAI1156245.1 hypothetical protein F4825DRAFT_404457 [Nemania diffusa]